MTAEPVRSSELLNEFAALKRFALFDARGDFKWADMLRKMTFGGLAFTD